jgi:hypothetical protein
MSATILSLDAAGTLTTLDATPQLIADRTVSPNSAGILRVRVMLRRPSDGAAKLFDMTYGFKRTTGAAGVMVLVAQTANGTAPDLTALSGATVTVAVDQVNTQVIVTGLAATELDWAFRIDGNELGHV